MNASKNRTFHYHASANPIGGQFTDPIQHVLAPKAGAALAQAGGRAGSSAGGMTLPNPKGGNLYSFDEAHSEITGRATVDKEGYWTTTVRSVVEGFHLLDIVRAQRIEAYIKVRHPHKGAKGGHPYISFEGTHFENLTIDGHAVHVDLDLDGLSRSETHLFEATEPGEVDLAAGVATPIDSKSKPQLPSPSELKEPWEQSKRIMDPLRKRNKALIDAAAADQPWVKERYTDKADPKKGRILCSLVKSVSIDGNGSTPYKTYGHIIHVPEVGNLFLAELSVRDGGFRLTMLRAEMGCKAEGEMSVADADSDGRTIP